MSLLHKFIIPFWFPECKPGSISGLLNGTWTFSSLHYPDIFPVYGMETGIFPFYGMKPENFSGLRNKYHGSGNFRKPEKFRFPFHPEIFRNSTLRNKFPNRSSSKMKILFRNNGNPNNYYSTFKLKDHYLSRISIYHSYITRCNLLH